MSHADVGVAPSPRSRQGGLSCIQTNGKLERFHKSIEDEIFHYESLSAYVKYYNERRLHFSLDIRNRQTPLMAFSDRKATDAIRENNPKWVEEDLHD